MYFKLVVLCYINIVQQVHVRSLRQFAANNTLLMISKYWLKYQIASSPLWYYSLWQNLDLIMHLFSPFFHHFSLKIYFFLFLHIPEIEHMGLIDMSEISAFSLFHFEKLCNFFSVLTWWLRSHRLIHNIQMI